MNISKEIIEALEAIERGNDFQYWMLYTDEFFSLSKDKLVKDICTIDLCAKLELTFKGQCILAATKNQEKLKKGD